MVAENLKSPLIYIYAAFILFEGGGKCTAVFNLDLCDLLRCAIFCNFAYFLVGFSPKTLRECPTECEKNLTMYFQWLCSKRNLLWDMKYQITRTKRMTILQMRIGIKSVIEKRLIINIWTLTIALIS
jgi:hypothetical protein